MSLLLSPVLLLTFAPPQELHDAHQPPASAPQKLPSPEVVEQPSWPPAVQQYYERPLLPPAEELANTETCLPFRASLSNTTCAGMARHKPGDETAQACHAECCRAGDGCNAWNWHDVGQCHLSPKRLSPSTDECHPNGAWTGGSRGTPAPKPPPPPPKRDWNLQPGLLPPSGMWRGATIDKRFPPEEGEDEIRAFETAYGHRLHIYRGFKTEHYAQISPGELAFIEAGGILFYSVEPTNWSAWGDWHAAWKIKRFADAIKAVAPAQVMLAPGYEADGHAAESQKKAHLVYGTAAEYQRMWRNFRRVFAQENVTNALFVLDLSCNLREWSFVLPKLYPGEGLVDWAFFNLFQSHRQAFRDDSGNCSAMARELYATLDDGVLPKTIPWGVGAWGTMSPFGRKEAPARSQAGRRPERLSAPLVPSAQPHGPPQASCLPRRLGSPRRPSPGRPLSRASVEPSVLLPTTQERDLRRAPQVPVAAHPRGGPQAVPRADDARLRRPRSLPKAQGSHLLRLAQLYDQPIRQQQLRLPRTRADAARHVFARRFRRKRCGVEKKKAQARARCVLRLPLVLF